MTTVHLVLGLLGSGKTTLLQHVLGVADGREPPVVLVGERADLDADADALADSASRVRRIGHEGGWAEALRDLLADRPERLVVETSGATDAAALVAAVRDLEVEWGRVVTVVDGPLLTRFEAHFPANLAAQLAAADLVVVNKRDRLDDAAEAAALASIRRFNPAAEVQLAFMGQIPVRAFYADRGGSLPEGLVAAPEPLETWMFRSATRCFDRAGFGHAILNAPVARLLRVKGRVLAWNGGYDVSAVPGQLDWRPLDDAPSETTLAFIGQGIDAGATQRALDAALASLAPS